ncbi:MAG: hypothetical protein A2Y74_04245 [Actinobacteria bacterium RBG_13_63_9]|nr:MAG: hypothetical protein A2Y74_04245 [Actinobacteria bacterium RBG_13_63_9]
MKISKWARVLAISTAVLALVGLSVSCGGGGDGEKEATGPDDYAKAVCQAIGKYYAEGEALFGDSSALENAEDPGELQDAIEKAQPLVKGMADDLDKIKPPSEVKDWHEGTVAGLTTAAELFGELKDILDKPLEEAMAEITELQPELEGMADTFGSISDLPSEYQDAFENEPECANLDIFGE